MKVTASPPLLKGVQVSLVKIGHYFPENFDVI